MRISKLWAILASASLLSAPAAAFADSYQLFTLHSDQGYFFNGMDDAGHVVINNGLGQLNPTYYTFLNGIATGSSTTAPTFTSDPGTSCSPAVPSGGSVQHGVCNNGRDAFTGFVSAGQMRPSVYVGPSFQNIFLNGGEGFIFMNSVGNIVFDDDFSQTWFEAIDITAAPNFIPSAATAAPEPSTLLLIATGMLAPIFFLRRRRTAPTSL